MSDDLAELRALSDAATQGEWVASNGSIGSVDDGYLIADAMRGTDDDPALPVARPGGDADDAEFIVAAVNRVRAVLAASPKDRADDALRGAVEALHRREPRWQDHPESELSFKEREDAVEYLEVCGGTRLIKPHRFDVCSHCAMIEEHDEQRDPGAELYSYLHSLWPCATARAALAGGDSR